MNNYNCAGKCEDYITHSVRIINRTVLKFVYYEIRSKLTRTCIENSKVICRLVSRLPDIYAQILLKKKIWLCLVFFLKLINYRDFLLTPRTVETWFDIINNMYYIIIIIRYFRSIREASSKTIRIKRFLAKNNMEIFNLSFRLCLSLRSSSLNGIIIIFLLFKKRNIIYAPTQTHSNIIIIIL